MNTDKTKEFWKGKTPEEASKAYDNAMTVIMLVEFAITLCIFFLLKKFASATIAEMFLVIAYAVELKISTDMTAKKFKDTIMEKTGFKNEEKPREQEEAIEAAVEEAPDSDSAKN